MIEVQEIASNVYMAEDGMWRTFDSAKISYTQNGHDLIKESEQKSFWFKHRLNCLAIILDLFPVDSVLDIGGGNGEISMFFQKQGIEVVLIEPRMEGAYTAFQNGVKNVVQGSLINTGIKKNSVQGIVLLDVLEHIEKDEEFLDELFRILAPEGKLFLSVPSYNFLFSEFDKEVGHFRRYTLKKLTEKLKKTGFNIQFNSYLFHFLPIPIFLTRLFYSSFHSRKRRRKLGHINKEGILGKLLQLLLVPELFFIKLKMKIPFGSSCFVVVNKPLVYEK
ncbi:class I SAM-dependent methyltransferase [Flexithrix dorotheae]|uniref:class I SAM-dependent methyltransferase n=1 Tax=Flexithrix dorotheae TaxID=70993 RepID=UPI0003622788|nr:class I SAM-dependent methyltransferase [Flexithrix dorotheae]